MSKSALRVSRCSSRALLISVDLIDGGRFERDVDACCDRTALRHLPHVAGAAFRQQQAQPEAAPGMQGARCGGHVPAQGRFFAAQV